MSTVDAMYHCTDLCVYFLNQNKFSLSILHSVPREVVVAIHYPSFPQDRNKYHLFSGFYVNIQTTLYLCHLKTWGLIKYLNFTWRLHLQLVTTCEADVAITFTDSTSEADVGSLQRGVAQLITAVQVKGVIRPLLLQKSYKMWVALYNHVLIVSAVRNPIAMKIPDVCSMNAVQLFTWCCTKCCW